LTPETALVRFDRFIGTAERNVHRCMRLVRTGGRQIDQSQRERRLACASAIYRRARSHKVVAW
jgi:hypothetical protein